MTVFGWVFGKADASRGHRMSCASAVYNGMQSSSFSGVTSYASAESIDSRIGWNYYCSFASRDAGSSS
jgi:hypothetical protein